MVTAGSALRRLWKGRHGQVERDYTHVVLTDFRQNPGFPALLNDPHRQTIGRDAENLLAINQLRLQLKAGYVIHRLSA